MTFSIIAFNKKTAEIGVAVQSKLLAAGAVIPWAEPKLGAVLTQSIINYDAGPNCLNLLREGKTPKSVIEEILKKDQLAQLRQISVINSTGEIANFTGKNCLKTAAHYVGVDYSVQGNRLSSKEVLQEMASAYEESEQRPFPERLIKSLAAGQRAGGDKAGQQSAALLIVKADKITYEQDEIIDLRIDDDPEPIKKLGDLYEKYCLTFQQADKNKVVKISGAVHKRLYAVLLKHKLVSEGESALKFLDQAVRQFLKAENFQARQQVEGYLDLDILTYLERKA